MSRIFPKNSRRIAGAIVLGVMLFGGLLAAGVTYYFTPKYTRVGYQPLQPVPFSHKLHAGQIGLECTYCHTNVAQAPQSNVPATVICMNCHDPAKGNIKGDSPLLAPVREAWKTGMPVPWVRVHGLPGYVYFNHQVHVSRGVGCVTCHGRVDEMAEVKVVQPLSMSWCLDCHRNPGPNLQRDALAMQPAPDPAFAQEMIKESGVNPPTNCTTCHR